MNTIRLEIDLDKIEHNARTIVNICHENGIKVAGVTKGVGGMPEVARAMRKGGINLLADARLMNIKKINKAKPNVPTMLIRIPRMTRSKEVVKHFNISLISEWKVIKAISNESARIGKKHGIILMVDLGDLREGLMINEVIPAVKRILTLEGIQLMGLGSNLGCYGGVKPTTKNMQTLVNLVKKVEGEFDISLPIVSVGGTNCLSLLLDGGMPEGITQFRIGEGILLGKDGSSNKNIPGTYQDTFKLVSEIIEIKEKPSKPIGEIGTDAFGKVPKFKDIGIRKRAIIALGKQDVRLSGLKPIDEKVKVLGGSSDHIILDITDSDEKYSIGQEISFKLEYPSLLSAVTSPYVPHYIKEDEEWIKV